MESEFIKYWFGGFESALSKIDENGRQVLLKECGEACSSSYTRKIYIDEYSVSASIPDFLNILKDRFKELEFKYENNTVIFIYKYCACDLVTKGYLKTPLLCECSRFSLQNNWEAILGKGNVEVNLLQSILSGESLCKFQINIKNNNLK